MLPFAERIETERLILNRLQRQDAESIFYSYASKPDATRYVSWPTHKSLRDTRRFLDYAVNGWRTGVDYSFGIRLRDNGRFIGSFGLMNDDGKVQFGYILSPTHWGKGYTTEACLKVTSILRSFPDVFRIGTFVDVENIASLRVLQKAGLIEEAYLPKWFRFVNQDNQPKDCYLYRLP